MSTRRLTPLEGAWKKGRLAALSGSLESACPYNDTRKLDGRLTWSRAFRKAWIDGFRLVPPGIRLCDVDEHSWVHDGSSGDWCDKCFVSKRSIKYTEIVDTAN